MFGCTSRTAEYRFVFKHLPPVGCTLLDVGSADSLLPLKLAERGYKVHALDTRKYWGHHANLVFVQGDIVSTSFPDGSFDCVTAVSTIEHIGLGLYGDPIHEDADAKAIREISRILRPGGRLILTTPFAAEFSLAPYAGGVERYYDSATLQTLLEGFRVQEQEFFAARSRFDWVSVSEQQAKDPDLKWHANVGLVLIKEDK